MSLEIDHYWALGGVMDHNGSLQVAKKNICHLSKLISVS